MYRKKSAKEKLADDKDLPRLERITEGQRKVWGSGTIVIPAPREVDELMRRVPSGRITTINDIRSCLAKRHKATIACPITTGIFVSIAAQAAEENATEGKKRATPYWRTLKSRGELNEKYPGGIERQRQRLESEGFTVIQKGKNHVVKDFEKFLFIQQFR